MQTAKSTILIVMAICLSNLAFARAPKPEPVDLNRQGENLLVDYSVQLELLKADIQKAAPQIDKKKNAAYQKARKAERHADAQVKGAQAALNKNKNRGLLRHRQSWVKRSTVAKGEIEQRVKKAKAMTGPDAAKTLAAAEKELVDIIDNLANAHKNLKICEAAAKEAKRHEAGLANNLKAAQKALPIAKANTIKALNALGLQDYLTSDKLDVKLAKLTMLSQATPRRLAEFAQQGETQANLINKLLTDSDLLVQVMLADGPTGKNYGRAMQIYTDIQKASPKAKDGTLQRLALAVALQHATPIGQRNANASKDAPKTVNPVNRYMHYEKAYFAGELDPAFKDLTVWDYRMVVDSGAPDETLTWGRQMLGNYRPDHITNPNYYWRYVSAVRTDIQYGSKEQRDDKPELQFFQNILMNGGVCGRRAFFGGFMLRAFGLPTVKRPQRGHAALAHWTPDGWVPCFGGPWGSGWAVGPNGGPRRQSDLIFLAETQGRMAGKEYIQVKRAQWTALASAENKAFFNALATDVQRKVSEEAKAKTLAAVGTDIGEANESKVKEKLKSIKLTDNKITVSKCCGAITIPAAATSRPTDNTDKIKFMPSNLGGMQLHYERLGKKQETFEYTFDAVKAGKYQLTARVATPSWKQHLTVKANCSKPVDIALPHTVGMWDTTKPVQIELAKGKNVLTFSRDHEKLKGLTIKDFTLKPVN